MADTNLRPLPALPTGARPLGRQFDTRPKPKAPGGPRRGIPIGKLDEEQVVEWLEKQVGYAQYSQLFRENDIDGSVLETLDEGDLEKLGISSLGHRKKIAKAIQNYVPVQAKKSAARVNPTPRSTPPKQEASSSSGTKKAPQAVAGGAPAETDEEERLRKLREENEAKSKARLAFMKKDKPSPVTPKAKSVPSSPAPKSSPSKFAPVPNAMAVSDDSWQNKARNMSGLGSGDNLSKSAGARGPEDEQERLRRLQQENLAKQANKLNFMRGSKGSNLSSSGERGSPRPANWRDEERQRVIAMEMRERQDRMQAGRGQQSYMSVKVPLSEGVKSALQNFGAGNNFVGMLLNEGGEEVKAGFVGRVSVSELSSKLNANTPSFGILDFSHTTQTGQRRNANVFIYCCPAAAPKNLRMVYATAKTSVMRQIEDMGVRVEKSVEVAAPKDLTDKLLTEELYFSGEKAYSGFKTPEFDRHYIKNPHPLFGSKKKFVDNKVVLAPAEAYGSSTHNQ